MKGWGGLRKGRGLDQTFSEKMAAEKYTAKPGKLYAANMELERAFKETGMHCGR